MGIIKPVKGKIRISENAIMVIPKRPLEYLVKKLKPKDYGEIDGCLYKIYSGPDNTGICGPFIGSPHAVIGLEKLVAAGVKKVRVFSWCGSINPQIKIGDVVICIGSFSEEGTSKHYLGSDPVPDPALVEEIKQVLASSGIKFFEGLLWTTDAPYRETREKIAEYQKKGAIGVDMEISALMTVANFRSVSLAGVFVVSDELYGSKWKPGFSHPLLKEYSEKVLDVLIESLK